MDKRLKRYRGWLVGWLAAGVLGLCFYVFYFYSRCIPDELRLNIEEEQQFDWNLPVSASFSGTSVYASEEAQDMEIHVDMAKPFSVVGETQGSYVMECKLFGIIPLKSVQVNVQEKEYVTPGGYPVGIYLKTEGILVIGTSPITAADGTEQEPARNIVKSGDYIVSVNGREVEEKEELLAEVADCQGEDVVLGIRRNGETTEVKIQPVAAPGGVYRLGIWVRDNTQGIGTLTYVDGESNFGALGHGINDVDTSTLMEIDSGSLYEAEILSIVKGQSGTPGELMGMISYDSANLRGKITKNTPAGIFGKAGSTLSQECAASPVEVGWKQEIAVGPAVIRCYMEGELQEYEVEIEEIHLSGDDINKGIVLRVTDERLLALTGGIVQGMSGSPILQNGKIIGAVTHVFVQDSAKGFGIFIENMLNAM